MFEGRFFSPGSIANRRPPRLINILRKRKSARKNRFSSKFRGKIKEKNFSLTLWKRPGSASSRRPSPAPRAGRMWTWFGSVSASSSAGTRLVRIRGGVQGRRGLLRGVRLVGGWWRGRRWRRCCRRPRWFLRRRRCWYWWESGGGGLRRLRRGLGGGGAMRLGGRPQRGWGSGWEGGRPCWVGVLMLVKVEMLKKIKKCYKCDDGHFGSWKEQFVRRTNLHFSASFVLQINEDESWKKIWLLHELDRKPNLTISLIVVAAVFLPSFTKEIQNWSDKASKKCLKFVIFCLKMEAN